MPGMFPDSGVPAVQAANTTNTAMVNCAELFYSTSRCTPRFDPAAANAVISEILNFVAAFSHTYDCNKLTNMADAIKHICRLAVARDPDENDGILFCKDGTFSLATFSQFFELACFDLPAVSSNACDLQLVAYVTDADGCGRLVRYSSTSIRLDLGRFYHVQRARGVPEPAANTSYVWPDDLIANPYSLSELRTTLGVLDASNIPTNQADEARIGFHAVAQAEFTITCSTPTEFDYRFDIASELDLKGGYICWRYKAVGSSVWRYAKGSTDELASIASHNAVPQELNENSVTGPTIPAGSWIFQLLVLPASAANPVKYDLFDVPAAAGGPRITMRKRVG